MPVYDNQLRDRASLLLSLDSHSGEFKWLVNRGKARIGCVAGCRSTGKTRTTAYIVVSVDNVQYLAHRLAWLMYYGEFDQSLEIDHIDGNGLNNAKHNLRLVEHSSNMQNKQRCRKCKTNKAFGLENMGTKWRARISKDGVSIRLGTFSSEEEAANARVDAERKYGYHSNHGRSPAEVVE